MSEKVRVQRGKRGATCLFCWWCRLKKGWRVMRCAKGEWPVEVTLNEREAERLSKSISLFGRAKTCTMYDDMTSEEGDERGEQSVG